MGMSEQVNLKVLGCCAAVAMAGASAIREDPIWKIFQVRSMEMYLEEAKQQ
jgi:hypothetical protein